MTPRLSSLLACAALAFPAVLPAAESLVIEAEQFAALQATTLEQARLTYAALKNGSGTATERLVRVERVCAWLLRQQLGKEPA